MAFDAQRGVSVLFGGIHWDGSTHYYGDTWEWNGTVWVMRASSGPEPRGGHSITYEVARGVSVLFGGLNYNVTPSEYGDSWEWDGSAWSLRSCSGASPRLSFALTYDSARRLTELFGGVNNTTGYFFDDTWQYRGGALGDMNADGKINGLDIQLFVTAIANSSTNSTDIYLADFNSNGALDTGDIDGFVNVLLTAAP
jgi:hypothetical protein